MSTLTIAPPTLPTRNRGISVLATILTLIIVLSTLLTLLMNIGLTGGFTNSRPQGDQAMGLIVPFVGLGGTILLLTFVSLLACFRIPHAAVGAISSSPLLSGFLLIAITFGVCLAFGMAFMFWCEPMFSGPAPKLLTLFVGFSAGVGGPILLAVMLIIGIWMPKSSALTALATPGGNGLGLKLGFAALCILAFAGYGSAGTLWFKSIQHVAANRAAALANAAKEKAEWAAFERMTPKERLTEDFSNFSEDAPLWTIISYLPNRPDEKPLDDECRALVVQRALQVPDFDAQLLDCMTTDHLIYRQAAAEFLISAPEPLLNNNRDSWGNALLAGIAATTEGIACRPAWLSETFNSNPDPLGHVRSFLSAAQRFHSWPQYPQIQLQLAELTNHAGMLNTDAKREKLLALLAAAGYHPQEVRPSSRR